MKKILIAAAIGFLVTLSMPGFSQTHKQSSLFSGLMTQLSSCSPQEIGSCARVGGHLDSHCNCK